jgi:hypothetical protein
MMVLYISFCQTVGLMLFGEGKRWACFSPCTLEVTLSLLFSFVVVHWHIRQLREVGWSGVRLA